MYLSSSLDISCRLISPAWSGNVNCPQEVSRHFVTNDQQQVEGQCAMPLVLENDIYYSGRRGSCCAARNIGHQVAKRPRRSLALPKSSGIGPARLRIIRDPRRVPQEFVKRDHLPRHLRSLRFRGFPCRTCCRRKSFSPAIRVCAPLAPICSPTVRYSA